MNSSTFAISFLRSCVIGFFIRDHGRQASFLLPGGFDIVVSVGTCAINTLKEWRINLQLLTRLSHNTMGLSLPNFINGVLELWYVHCCSVSQFLIDSVAHFNGHLWSWVFYLIEVNVVCILGKWVIFDSFTCSLYLWDLLFFTLVLRLATVKESFIGGLVALIRRHRYSFRKSCFSSSKNVVNCVFSVWASSGESFQQVLLDLRLLRMVSSTRCRFPVLVSLKIAPIWKRILEMLQWAFLITPKRVFEYAISWCSNIVFGSEAAIMLKDVGISSTAIALVVKRWGLLTGRWWCSSCNVTVIFWKLNTVMAHSNLINTIKPSVCHDNLLVSSCTIPEVADVLGIECTLQPLESEVCLNFSWSVHIYFNKSKFFIYIL